MDGTRGAAEQWQPRSSRPPCQVPVSINGFIQLQVRLMIPGEGPSPCLPRARPRLSRLSHPLRLPASPAEASETEKDKPPDTRASHL
jgi:hypothetical protein